MDNDSRFGVIITKGPMNWQILQQVNGKADIKLEGSWYHPEEQKNSIRVYVRLFNENNNLVIVNGQMAEIEESDSWSCVLKDIPAGGPYRIETFMQEGADIIPFEWSCHGDMRHHICVGDLFVIAGQSNAAGYGKDSVEDPPEICIHMMRENGLWDIASHPLHDSTDTIFPAHQDGTATGHSPYLSFARTMKRKHNWPIGLIMAAKGGTPLDRFDPAGGGDLYRNMLDMVAFCGGNIRAIIWCQGASDANASNAVSYGERLRRTILQSRKDLGSPGLPWFIVQVSRYGDAASEGDCYWGLIRNHQRLLAHKLPHVYAISTIDSVTSDAVHNNAYSNVMIGERIAWSVLTNLYGRKHFLCPDIQSADMGKKDNEIILTFKNVIETVFHCHDQEMPFDVFNPDESKNPITKCDCSGNTVILQTENPVSEGSTVASLWQATPTFKPPFDSGSRLPILSFYGVKIAKS